MEKQIFCQFLVVVTLLLSYQIQGDLRKGCYDSGITVLMGCPNSIDKKLPAPPTPSEGCCTLVRTIGMKCVCEVITKGMEATIDMQKVVNVAAACGRPLAPGSQCGSKFYKELFVYSSSYLVEHKMLEILTPSLFVLLSFPGYRVPSA